METDLERLFGAFEASGGLSFLDFKAVWTQVDMSALHAELYDPFDFDATLGVYQDFYATILSYFDRPVHLRWKLAALYALYMTYTTQPSATPVPIRVGPFEWSRMRAVVNTCAPLHDVCDAQPILQLLYNGNAIVFAAYSGAESYASIARSARLYGLSDLFAGRGPAYPFIDHVAEAYFPDTNGQLNDSSRLNPLTSIVEEGSKSKLLQDRRRRAARRISVGGKRGRPKETYVVHPLLLAAASKASMFAAVNAPRDIEQRQRSREVGDLVLATLGLRRTPINFHTSTAAARLWFDSAFHPETPDTSLETQRSLGDRRLLIDFMRPTYPVVHLEPEETSGRRKRRRGRKGDDTDALDLEFIDGAYDASYAVEAHDATATSPELKVVISNYLANIPQDHQQTAAPTAPSSAVSSGATGILHSNVRAMPIGAGVRVPGPASDAVVSALSGEVAPCVVDRGWWNDEYARYDQVEGPAIDYEDAAFRLQRIALELSRTPHDQGVIDTIVGEEAV